MKAKIMDLEAVDQIFTLSERNQELETKLIKLGE